MQVTPDEVARLLAATPPRQVPRHVEAAARGPSAALLLVIFGLMFLLFGVVAMVTFVPWRWVDDQRLAVGAAQIVPGLITQVVQTQMSINDVQVVGYRFTYRTPGGQEHSGECYTTGARWTAGAEVRVRMAAGDAGLACVEGARLSRGSSIGFVALVFPLLGAGLVVGAIEGRRRRRHLLQRGVVRTVEIVSVEETNVQVNYRSVYRIVVRSPELVGGTLTVKRVHPGEVALALERVRERRPVYVLQDPRHPQRLLFPEAWLSRPPPEGSRLVR